MRVRYQSWQRHLFRTCCGPLCFWLFFLIFLTFPLPAQQAIALVGSGSSVPAPLYTKWAEQFNQRDRKIHFQYLPLGTAEGIKQISHGSGDFAVGEVPLTDKQRSEGNLIEVPTILVAIVPIYNVPGIGGEIRLTGPLLADIFLGRLKTWNSPAITRINPQLTLPSLPIKVVYRPGGKGSNYVFSSFLAKASPQFLSTLGASASPSWPVGSPAERSSDMVEKVRSESGSIGYVEAEYATAMKIPAVAVLNHAGNYVKASKSSVLAACREVEIPNWDKLSASLIDAPGAASYPITSFSWIYLKASSADQQRAAALLDLLDWMFTTGQQLAADDGYVALPTPLRDRVKAKIHSLR